MRWAALLLLACAEAPQTPPPPPIFDAAPPPPDARIAPDLTPHISALPACGADARCPAYAALVAAQDDAIEPLLTIVRDAAAQPTTRALAAGALAEIGAERAGPDLLKIATTTRDMTLSDALVEAAGATGSAAVQATLRGMDLHRGAVQRALATHPNTADWALANLDGARAGPLAAVIDRAARDEHAAAIAQAATASRSVGARLQLAATAARLGRAEHYDTLLAAIEGKDALAATTAARLLGPLCATLPEGLKARAKSALGSAQYGGLTMRATADCR